MVPRAGPTSLVLIAGLLTLVAGAFFLMEPRARMANFTPFDATSIGPDVDAYLANREARFGDIREGLQKQVAWAEPVAKTKTPLSIVYVHGFSASLGELRPLPDIVAQRLGANLYYTRLAGHGRSGDALAQATVDAWIEDVEEALAIGRRIGERVVLIGTSSGATLNTWAATRPEMMEDVAALVNISPNYGVNAPGAWLLTAPGAQRIANLLLGPNRTNQAKNALHAHGWTLNYPTAALLPMAALVRLTTRAEIDRIAVPALFVFSDEDTVVRPDLTRIVAQRWGARADLVLIENSDGPDHHVLAGDALSPSTTQAIADIIVDWIATQKASEPSRFAVGDEKIDHQGDAQ